VSAPRPDPSMTLGLTRDFGSGLGIGTSAWAMINHGIETDIVELDPAVYQYAMEYFALPRNHTAYVEDAVGFVRRETSRGKEGKKYDYILHDVFTGGAVPASLFTLQVFMGLRDMLNDDGVIAVVSRHGYSCWFRLSICLPLWISVRWHSLPSDVP
jgi:spermidine synthase